MAAAKAGDVASLEELEKAGRFHVRESSQGNEQDSVGEAAKLHAWEAVVAAFETGQADVLTWIFEKRPPDTLDVGIPWHVQDMVPLWQRKRLGAAKFVLQLDRLLGDWLCDRVSDVNSLSDIILCHAVISSPAVVCLDVLLGTGYRSPWLCTVAVMERKHRCFSTAAKAGCPITESALIAGAFQGNPVLLGDICGRFEHAGHRGWLELCIVPCALHAAISGGHVRSMEFLIRTYARSWEGLIPPCHHAVNFAIKLGQLECLQAALRYVPCRVTLQREGVSSRIHLWL